MALGLGRLKPDTTRSSHSGRQASDWYEGSSELMAVGPGGSGVRAAKA